VIIFNVVSKIDLTITIGVIISKDFFGNIDDINTIPSTFTFWYIEWTVTEDMTITWTIGISEIIFNNDKTSMDFTGIKRTIIISVTFG